MTTEPLLPLRRAAGLLVVVGLIAAAGCSGPAESAEDPAPPSASPTLSAEEQDAIASLNALLDEEDRLRAEGPGAEVTDTVEQHATDPYVQQLAHSLGWLSVENIRVEGAPTRLLVESQGEVTAEEADLVVCMDVSTAKKVMVENGEPYDDGSSAEKVLTVYEMRTVEGEWKVKDQTGTTLLDDWNQAPCDGAWES